jgi:hypothetical protein
MNHQARLTFFRFARLASINAPGLALLLWTVVPATGQTLQILSGNVPGAGAQSAHVGRVAPNTRLRLAI